ncbi:MAG: hypothetical protein WAQ27_05830 [Candidatus Microsaccharimonas sp.]
MNTENTSHLNIQYPAYYVTTAVQADKKQLDDTVLIAIDVTIEDGIIKWYDTLKERSFIYDTISQTTDNGITFTSSSNQVSYTLIALTLDIYDTFVGPKIAGTSSFVSNDELWEKLLATKTNQW